MSIHTESEALEREAYRASMSDGSIDLYAGLSLIWIGATWIWITDLAGLAGVLPAIFIAPMLAARQRFVEARLGYVKWRAPRRRWERRNQGLLLVAGLLALVLGVVAFLAVRGDGDAGGGVLAIGPGLLAWLLTILALGLAALLSSWRMVGYAVVLATTGTAAILTEANPGWPMLLTGLVVTASGTVMLWRFVREHPVRTTT